MKIHHLRNATFVMESRDHCILVDPMLSRKGQLPPFAVLRHKPERNPTVPLPENAPEILSRVTHCLVTHSQKWGLEPLTHTDHLDGAGKKFLKDRAVPVVCGEGDAAYMKKQGISVELALYHGRPEEFLGGRVISVPARHGHGFMHHLMVNGSGYYLALPGEPSIYIAGDTVYTEAVQRTLLELKPDIAVVAAGSASLDLGGHILMSPEEILSFVKDAPGLVIANHMEALNHCPTRRARLKEELGKAGLLSKTMIPADGETLCIGGD